MKIFSSSGSKGPLNNYADKGEGMGVNLGSKLVHVVVE
jgi:hypothetical protein